MTRQTVSRRFLFGLPLGILAVGGTGFYILLERMRSGSYNPHAFNNPLVGHHVPKFSLPGIDQGKGFDSAELSAMKRPILVNFFASWCVPCAREAPYLGKLAESGLDIWGIAYQDKAKPLALYLAKHGNPYMRLASDLSGRTASTGAFTVSRKAS